MSRDPEQTRKRFRITVRGILISSILLLIWLASFYLVKNEGSHLPQIKDEGDMATTLFGAASVALFVLSILIGIVAIFGWQAVEGKIREAVDQATGRRLGVLENELRGRFFAILGYVIGENSVTRDFTAPSDEERLREALLYCEQGYALLKGTGLPAEFMALNNFLGYSCVLHDKSRRGYVLEEARRLRAAAEEHDSPNLLLTYSRTVLEFGLEPKEIQEACSIVADVQSNPRLNEKQKREAQYLASLCRRRAAGEAGRPLSPWQKDL